MALLSSSASAATWPRPGFTEGPADQNTTFPQTIATDVTVDAPLPASFPAHPAACDKLHFLRVRHVGGPTDPSNADKILIAQPGVLEGASAFYNIAADMVTRAFAEKGKYVEFWAVDRRPNCLEDLNGFRLARQTGNVHDLIDYYYRGKPYNGQRFGGWINPLSGAAWLVDMGMDQTVKDWNTIITRGIPSQADRQQKVYCGGHSLGGFVAGAYADADFDGNPSTTADAGYNQCAGFFGLDTVVSDQPLSSAMLGSSAPALVTSLLGQIPNGVVSLMRQGLFERFVDIPGVLDPEVMNLLTGVGYAAKVAGTQESDLISYLPTTPETSLAERFYHSRNIADFLALQPTIQRFRYTNQALLATFSDDNAMPLTIVRASIGFFKGGPVADKNFPVSSTLGSILSQVPLLNSLTGVINGNSLAIPTNSGTLFSRGPLYSWANYNQLGSMTIPRDSHGVPYTSPAKEATDVNDFARSVGALPMDLVEKYFPVRLAVDSLFGTTNVHPEGISAKPILDITAGDGPGMGGSLTPPGSPVIPGYNHLDVMTAAPVQNNGGAEPVATDLLHFLYH